MIRRKMLVILGSLLTLWLVAAVVAIALLDGVLSEVDEVSSISQGSSTETTELLGVVNATDKMLIGIAVDQHRNDDETGLVLATLQAARDRFDSTKTFASGAESIGRARTAIDGLIDQLQALRDAPNADAAPLLAREALAASTQLHDEIAVFSDAEHEAIRIRQEHASSRFRGTAFGLGLTFLLLLNGSILMLLRAAVIILSPVEKLVTASRRLAREEFDSRVEIDGNDEFTELAQAYNSLAEELQKNESRRIETTHQIATTLNHELNNALAIIDLQLRMMERRDRARQLDVEPFEQIHQTLERMRRTIGSLARIRRIVLTDYGAGITMLDLQRSVEDDESSSAEDEPAATGSVNV